MLLTSDTNPKQEQNWLRISDCRDENTYLHGHFDTNVMKASKGIQNISNFSVNVM
jgi:hypothetical protein